MIAKEPLAVIELPCTESKRRRNIKGAAEKIALYPEYLEWTGRYSCEERPVKLEEDGDDGESWKENTQWKTVRRDWRQRIHRKAIINIERERNDEGGTWDITLWAGGYPITLDLSNRTEADQVYDALNIWLDW